MRSGFVSRNNPDPTARNLANLLAQAELPRSVTVIWNVVPWYIGSDAKIRSANASDVEAGQRSLLALLRLLPKVREVVLVGRKAQRARPALSARGKLRLTDCPHPSNQVFNRWPEKRTEALRAFQSVARRLTMHCI